ncbi:MAG: cytochrome P450, partial [Candidatus Nanopelagicales bacterium]
MNPRALPALDPSDHEFSRNPFQFYDTLRELAPITPILLSNGTTAWFVTTASAARAVLLDSRFSAMPPVKDRRPERAGLENHMLNTDAPEHTRLRQLVTATFSTARIDALTPRIEQIADDLLSLLDNDAEERRPVDLVDRYAFPLPVAVMCEVLGVPNKDREALRSWTYAVSAPRTSVGATPQHDAWTNMHAYFKQLITHKRQHPSDDLFSELINAHDSDGALSTEELLSMAFLLLFAGYETTMNLISGAVFTLAERPAEAARLATASNDEWDTTVEELLRYVSPLEGATWRFAARDIEVEGVTVPAGSSVMVSLAAANHDPLSFAQPHTFQSGREPNRHLAFGYGPHHCVGARLARIEGRVALSRLIARYPSLRLVDESNSLRWRPGLLVRGPSQLPVQLGDPIEHLDTAQQRRVVSGLDRTITARGPNPTLLDLASNDYLGLSHHPQVIDAGIAALRTWGAGSTGSRLVTGSLDIHRDLEHSLAEH